MNDRVTENNQVIIDNRDKISELSELKTKVDTLCTASNVKMSSSSRTFYHQGSNADSTFKRQLKFIGVNENFELKNQNEPLLNDKNSIATICFGNGVDVNIEDCRRLGRYTQDQYRPLLDTIAKKWDARKCRSKAIENRLYHDKGILVVPELSYEDRRQDEKVLKNCYEMLQNNVDRSRI